MPRAPSELSRLISPDSKLPPKYIFVMLLIIHVLSHRAASYIGVGCASLIIYSNPHLESYSYAVQDVCDRPIGALRPSRAIMPQAPSELSRLINPDSKLPPKYIFVTLFILIVLSRRATSYIGVR